MSGLAEVLAEHGGTTFDLGTPRQHTRHGGWNEACACGEPLGDGGHPTSLDERHRAHVEAAALAWFAALLGEDGVREAVAEAINRADDEALVRTDFERLCATYAEQATAALAAVVAAVVGSEGP